MKAEPVQAVAQEVESKRPEAPVMDLYDLFGYTQEERRLAERGLKPERKKSGKSKGKKAVQPTLFSLPKSGKEEAAKKESGKVKAKSTEAASDITSLTPEEAQEMEEIIRNRMDVPQASRQETVSATSPDVKDASETTEDDDPEDAIYRSLDWETNPPINGFYEMMMSLTPERRAELRRLGREKMDANAAKQAERAAEAKKRRKTGYGNGATIVRAPILSR